MIDRFEFDKSVLCTRISPILACHGEEAFKHICSRMPSISTPTNFDHVFGKNARLFVVGKSRVDEGHNLLYGGNPVLVYNVESALLNPSNHRFPLDVYKSVVALLRKQKESTEVYNVLAGDNTAPLPLLALAHNQKRRDAMREALRGVPKSLLCPTCMIHLRCPKCPFCEPEPVACYRMGCWREAHTTCDYCYEARYCSWEECGMRDWEDIHRLYCARDKIVKSKEDRLDM